MLKKQFTPIKLGAPGEEIDRKNLHQVISRFKVLHQSRLQHIQQFLLPRQQVFLDILALIFHQNHAALPGFYDPETPHGILDFKPGPVALQACRKHFRNFRYRRKALIQYAIEGIFLMGSVGSIAFSKSSDIDIWLCHDSTLNAKQLENLQKKASAVEAWAEHLDLEVHFFLMDAVQFRQGQHIPISSESSGDTQHYLLLEEFYRTAIYVAGKAPAWWLVPPEQDAHYTEYINHLLGNRFISNQDIIDFGGLDKVPAEEFISATLWHIYKSLKSPYKSLLKLFLMEAYASEYPDTGWLANQIKHYVYAGDMDFDALDPYFLVYQKVENYLRLVRSQKRLALARACFYLKIMGSAPNQLPAADRQMRQDYLQGIARQWGWPDGELERLGQKKHWDIHKAVTEHDIIRDQLKQCLQMISRFASRYSQPNRRHNQDLKLIARKLHSCLEQRPGKVSLLTTRYSVRSKALQLSLIENDIIASQWQIYTDPISEITESSQAIKTCHSFIEALCWIIANDLYHPQLRVHTKSDSLSLSTTDTQRALSQIHQFLSPYLQQADTLERFALDNRCQAVLLFINLGQPLDQDDSNPNLLISPRSDPLSYGLQRSHFIRTTDRIIITRWGEIRCSRHTRIDGLFECLLDFFNNSVAPSNPDNLHISCLTPLRGRSIQTRIDQVIKQVRTLQHESRHWRYFIAIGPNYYQLHNKGDGLKIDYLENEAALFQQLNAYQTHFIQTHFDPYVLQETVIPLLYQHSQPDTVQVFYRQLEQKTDIYSVDERATFFHCHYADNQVAHILNHLQLFLSNLFEQAKLPENINIRFFELQQNSAGVMSCHPLPEPTAASFTDLSIRVSASDDGQYLTIYCNGEAFSQPSSADIFKQTRDFILNFRKSDSHYCCFITGMDVPCQLLGAATEKQLQTSHYLNYKHTIEHLISPDFENQDSA